MSEQPLWTPAPGRIARTNLARFAAFVGCDVLRDDGSFDYAALHRWSVDSPEAFWPAVWRFCDVVAGGDEAAPWAEVSINGNPAGQTPLANMAIPIGTHEIVFRHPQFGEQRHTVVVKADEPTRVSANFRP